jgi:hypothetical protein
MGIALDDKCDNNSEKGMGTALVLVNSLVTRQAAKLFGGPA